MRRVLLSIDAVKISLPLVDVSPEILSRQTSFSRFDAAELHRWLAGTFHPNVLFFIKEEREK